MYYEINVSLNGKHFFATAKRSITVEHELRKVLLVFEQKFPETEGYNVSATYWPERGEGVDIKKILKSAKVYVKLESNAYGIYKKTRDAQPLAAFSDYETLTRYCEQNGYIITKIDGIE